MKEDLAQIIADRIVKKIMDDKKQEQKDLTVPVGVSARHLHLCKEHLEILFGEGYSLKKMKELMGGQFACEEMVTIVGPKMSAIEKVRILGPLRSKTQVELSQTDAIKLGVKAPVRESGKIQGAATITIIGPKGALTVSECCIVAKRHIHMSPSDAVRFNVSDNEKVAVVIPGERGGIMNEVQIRVDESYTLEMHIDTDEANALGIKCGSRLEIKKL